MQNTQIYGFIILMGSTPNQFPKKQKILENGQAESRKATH